MLTQLVNLVIGTVVLGSIDAMIALGFVYMYRATGLVNFAYGEFMALGAWLTITAIDRGIPGIPAIVIGCAVVGVLAGAVYRGIIARVESNGLFVAVVATLGLGSVLEGLFPLVWGNASRPLNVFPTGAFHVRTGAGITVADVVVACIALAAYLLLVTVDKRLMFGVRMRASAANRLLASHLGISVRRSFFLAWAIAGLLAALAGIAFADTTLISSDLSTAGLAALPAALVGGFDSVVGAYPGAMIVAFAVTLAATFWSTQASVAVSYIVLLLTLLVMPSGLFGSRAVERV